MVGQLLLKRETNVDFCVGGDGHCIAVLEWMDMGMELGMNTWGYSIVMETNNEWDQIHEDIGGEPAHGKFVAISKDGKTI